MNKLNLTIPDRCITKKNSQQIVRAKNGHYYLIPKKRYKEYERSALWSIAQQLEWNFETIRAKVAVCALYWLPSKRGWPDLIGLEESTADILQEAGVIENDKNIVNWDGSRIAGIDSNNPRTEITVYILENYIAL